MCLKNIKKVAPTYIGYKMLISNSGDIQPFFSFCANSPSYKVGKWYNADTEYSPSLPSSEDGYYHTGFHIVTNLRDAIKYYNIAKQENWSGISRVIFAQVKYTGMLASGYDDSSAAIGRAKIRCDVAARMQIEKFITLQEFLEMEANIKSYAKRVRLE